MSLRSRHVSGVSKPLLDIIVIWHPDDWAGDAVFKKLLSHYHSSAFSGLVGGTIEVYPRSLPWRPAVDIESSDEPFPIPVLDQGSMTTAHYIVIVPVIDAEMINATLDPRSKWNKYLSKITQVVGDSNRQIVIPICASGLPIASLDENNPVASLINNFQAITLDSRHLDVFNALHLNVPRDDMTPKNHVEEKMRVDDIGRRTDSDTSWTDSTYLERNLGQAIIQNISDEWTSEHPLKVFISHAKLSGGLEPEVVAVVRKVLKDTKLHNFFDKASIQSATQWKNEIRNNASRCALLMVRTDNYAGRQWPQEEVTLAKLNDVPIVALSALTDGEERGCFLMDHVPTVAYNTLYAYDSAAKGITRLVDEALKRALWEKQDTFDRTTGIDWRPAHAPEPLTVANWLKEHDKNDKHLWVVHPDPPLTMQEKRLIKNMCDLAGFDSKEASLEIVTPREFNSRGGIVTFGDDPSIQLPAHSLKGIRVGISTSISDDLARLGLSVEHLKFAIAELAQLTFVHGGTFVYGGRVQKDRYDITSFIAEQAEKYATGNEIAFYNFMSWAEFMKADCAALDRFSRMFAGKGILKVVSSGTALKLGPARRKLLSEVETVEDGVALTDMRQVLVRETDARVLIGGSISRRGDEYVPGTLEEAYLSVLSNKPLYICGGFGGVGAHLARDVGLPTPHGYNNEIDDVNRESLRKIDSIKERWSVISNGLDENEQSELATSHHPSIIAGLVLRGLGRLKKRGEINRVLV